MTSQGMGLQGVDQNKLCWEKNVIIKKSNNTYSTGNFYN